MSKDELFIVATGMATQAVMDGAANDRAAYWLKKLDGKQLARFIHVCKKLTVLAEVEYRLKKSEPDNGRDSEASVVKGM